MFGVTVWIFEDEHGDSLLNGVLTGSVYRHVASPDMRTAPEPSIDQ